MGFYPVIKHLHMTLAMISIAGFLLRGYWMISNSPLLHLKPVKIVPHIIDTALLVSAICLMVLAGFYPWVAHWVGAKILLLVVYIVLGTFALKRAKSKRVRITCFVFAVGIFFAIYALAMIKPFF